MCRSEGNAQHARHRQGEEQKLRGEIEIQSYKIRQSNIVVQNNIEKGDQFAQEENTAQNEQTGIKRSKDLVDQVCVKQSGHSMQG